VGEQGQLGRQGGTWITSGSDGAEVEQHSYNGCVTYHALKEKQDLFTKIVRDQATQLAVVIQGIYR